MLRHALISLGSNQHLTRGVRRHITSTIQSIHRNTTTHRVCFSRVQPLLSTQSVAAGFSTSSNSSMDTQYDEKIQQFLQAIHELCVDEALVKGSQRDEKVTDFRHPKELDKLLNLEIVPEGMDNNSLLNICKDIIKYSVKTTHPLFINQQYAGVDPYSLAGAWVTEALNTNAHTYEAAPAFVLIERHVVEKVRQLAGYTEADGIFCPGGSIGNMYGMHMARYKRFPELKTQGMFGSKRMVLFASEEAHYCIKKGASFLGFGLDNAITVKTDRRGSMILQDLEDKIAKAKQEGHIPLFVMASCGTTVLGSFDDLEGIADICQKYNIWMHVDAAWGGGALLSSTHRTMLKGIERSDSMMWNFHKMMGAQLQSSIFLLKHKGLLAECNASNASYLFQQDKFYDMSYDTGDKSIQCGRKGDGLKVWAMWRAYGDEELERQVDANFDNARYFTERIRTTPGFRLVLDDPMFVNVGFWYIPPSLRGQPETEEWWQKIGKVAPVIKERMVKEGSMMIGYQPLAHKGLCNFFRIVLSNPRATSSDMDNVISIIDRLGNDL